MQKTLVLAFLMLGATVAFAQSISDQTGNQPFGFINVPYATMGATMVTTCTFVDSDYHAAVSFDLATDQTVHIEGNVYDPGLSCTASPQMVAGDLPLPAGHNIVYLTTPFTLGHEMSMNWSQIGIFQCGACYDYRFGQFPDVCQ